MPIERTAMYWRLSKPKRYLTYVIIVGIIVVLYFLFSSIEKNLFRLRSSAINTEPFPNDALKTPRKYQANVLHEWTAAPRVPHIFGLPGEMGKPVQLHSKEEEGRQRFKEHEFNIVVSEMIAANRSLSDMRDPQCLNITYQSKLPKTSIIIIFHNEAWWTLVRSLWSIINRSPKELVKEIILVDDKSTFDFLGNQLDEYVKILPIAVKVVRMEDRCGIVKARLLGAEHATGEVITFLDSHIECGGREDSSEIDVSSRIALRKKLNCKNFQWYIDKIYPEIDVRKNVEFIGQIQNVDSQTCLVANEEYIEAGIDSCNKTVADQIFFLTEQFEIRYHDLCLDAVSSNCSVKLWKCHLSGGNQKWVYDEQTLTFRHNIGSCLQRSGPNEKFPNVKPCDGSEEQQWFLISKNINLK